MKKIAVLLSLGIAYVSGCKSQPAPAGSGQSGVTDFQLKEIWRTDTVLRTPESAYYNIERDEIYVANINSNPGEMDKNGFISRLSPSGEILDLQWIKGLSGPKGMGVYGDYLYVTDITNLVIIDIKQGKILQTVPVEGAVFLNDLTVDRMGKVYFTDSRDGKIYTWSERMVKPWISGLSNPNGLYAEDSRILMLTNSLNSVDPVSGKVEVLTENIGHGDGVVYAGTKGYYLVSDWNGEVFLIYPDYSKKSVLQTRDKGMNTADIGFIEKDNILLVPTFFDNRVVAYKLQPVMK